MTNQPAAPKPATFEEAPASWNVRYLLNGYDCQLTLRGETGQDVLQRGAAALKWLAENGAQPAGTKPTATNGSTNGNGQDNQPHVCELHNAELKKHEANGQVWYSHKLADGTYCKGKAK